MSGVQKFALMKTIRVKAFSHLIMGRNQRVSFLFSKADRIKTPRGLENGFWSRSWVGGKRIL